MLELNEGKGYPSKNCIMYVAIARRVCALESSSCKNDELASVKAGSCHHLSVSAPNIIVTKDTYLVNNSF